MERDGLADTFLADATRLKQVVVNLLGNAIKFTDAGEIVVVLEIAPARVPDASVLKGSQRIRVSVRDSGVGIPESARAKVFEFFTQVDGTTTRRFEGTGLGLAICKQIVEKMAGVIGVEGELGSGSTFWFEVTLPVIEGDGSCALEDAARIAGRRVLVVDDNATNREVVRHHLGYWRIRSSECESGAEALLELRRATERGDSFDAVVLDWMMPGMDGLELARRMRAEARLPKIPIVMLTSIRVAERDVADLGVSARLTKPIRRADLYEAMVASLAGQEPAPPKATPAVRPHVRGVRSASWSSRTIP